MNDVLKNPLMLALDVDSEQKVHEILKQIGDLCGAIKLGPRLVMRYGSQLITEVAKTAPVFVDMKHFDIPSTMEAAVRASFEAGASVVTVHALSGHVALRKMSELQAELNKKRPFQVLAVSILTSWSSQDVPSVFKTSQIDENVENLAQLCQESGIDGMVCSPHELEKLSQYQFKLVTPGIRLSTDKVDDQKRTLTPRQAIQNGAWGLVVGRPIIESNNMRQKTLEFLKEIQSV